MTLLKKSFVITAEVPDENLEKLVKAEADSCFIWSPEKEPLLKVNGNIIPWKGEGK